MTERPRVLVHSPRASKSASPAISPHIEMENLIAEMDTAEIVAPPLRSSMGRLPLGPIEKVHNRLAKASHRGAARNLSFAPVQPAHDEYEMFFALLLCPDDALGLLAVDRWRERSGVAVAWLIEAWYDDLDTWKGHWDLLAQFDHVFVTMEVTRDKVGEKVGSPVGYLPYGTDTLVFSPPSLDRSRPIDMLSLGRRTAGTHAHLLDRARREDFYYQYDSIHASEVKDHVEHRFLYASQAQRSKFFVAHRSKIGAPEIGDQHEFGGRFFDAAAAGTVSVGEFPDTDRFREAFDWEGWGIPLAVDADPAPVFEMAADDPDRIEAGRRRSIANSLDRHDWLHRWSTILDAAGLDESAGMQDRRRALDERRSSFLD